MMSWLRRLPWLLAGISIACGPATLDPRKDAGGTGSGTAGSSGTGAGGGQQPDDAGRADVARIPDCPDGIVDSVLGETCDDGNKTPNDGCSPVCQVECSWSCGTCGAASGPCIRVPACGDGRRDSPEACDDGNSSSGDGCARDCLVIEAGWRCPAPGRRCIPICGDGRIVPPETCDDGNTIAGDGCSDVCVADGSGDRCGDGIITGAEECDLGEFNTNVPSYDACTEDCRMAQWCGDGIVNGPEECDQGTGNNIVTYDNKDGCAPGCRIPHYCGDGIVDTDVGEQCDFGPKNGAQFDGSLSYYCTVTCKMILI